MSAVFSDQELVSLADSHDIITLGMMADEVRRRLHGNKTTFVRVATVPLDGDSVPSLPSAGELRIVGTPRTRQAAVDRVSAVAAFAQGTPLSGFSLADLERISASDGATLRSVLEELHSAGLELVAEGAIDTLQDPRRSIEEVNIAGLALARLTVHQLSGVETVSFFKRVAEVQRRVAVIRTFAPLAQTFNPSLPTTGYDDVKRIALARLIVENIPSIQVNWSLYGPKLAQVALTVGADDVDGVSAEDDLSEGRRRAPLEEIHRNIRAAGQQPIERNGRFDIMDGRAAKSDDAAAQASEGSVG